MWEISLFFTHPFLAFKKSIEIGQSRLKFPISRQSIHLNNTFQWSRIREKEQSFQTTSSSSKSPLLISSSTSTFTTLLSSCQRLYSSKAMNFPKEFAIDSSIGPDQSTKGNPGSNTYICGITKGSVRGSKLECHYFRTKLELPQSQALPSIASMSFNGLNSKQSQPLTKM